MKRTAFFSVILIVLCLFFPTSCSRDKNTVWDIQAQPYVRTDGSMGLSLYMISSSEEDETVQMVVEDPSGNLSWSFNARQAKSGTTTYIGSPDIRMPAGSVLPQGTWSVDILFKDGTTVTEEFDVSYDDSYEIPEDLTEVVFDSGSNLTFIPVPEKESSDESSDLPV